MLRLDLTKKTIAFLDKLPPKQFKQVSKKIFSLMADPKPHDSRPLKNVQFWSRSRKAKISTTGIY